MTRETPDLNDIEQLFILGDSYSDVGWRSPECPLPTSNNPLGIEHPCDWATWSTSARWQDNWVQHLSRARSSVGHDLKIYDYVIGGSALKDVWDQAGEMVKLVTDKVIDLNVDKAVFVIWIGVNDVCGMDKAGIPRAMEFLAQILKTCYDAGFRHLVLFDVPPRAKPSPASGGSVIYDSLMDTIALWNKALPAVVDRWTGRDGATAKLFSANRVFTDIMDQPERYGFAEKDSYTRQGGIWADHVHPTTAVHNIVYEAFKAEME